MSEYDRCPLCGSAGECRRSCPTNDISEDGEPLTDKELRSLRDDERAWVNHERRPHD